MKPLQVVMPPATALLFERLNGDRLLGSFTLIGGTALALHIGHRLSQDLDFITTQDKLPRTLLQRLAQNLKAEGLEVVPIDDPAAHDDFLIAGMDLHDYSQNWLVGGEVKVTFFTGEPHHKSLLQGTEGGEGFAIASFDQCRDLKAIVATSRSKSRDWVDLFVLERDHRYGLSDWRNAYQKAGLTDGHFETALNRICSGIVQKDDEGYHSLMSNPPTVAQMARHFRDLREAYEVETARNALAPKSSS